MDSQEQFEIEHAKQTGKPQTDEGPYYHEAWWESYKGGVKGKLGGILIGATIGAAIGTLMIPMLAMVGITGAGAIVAGFTGAGMLYTMHDFNAVGHSAGSDAAVAEKLEARLKDFHKGENAEIKQEISEIKSLLTGEPAKQIATPETSPDYPTKHCDNEHCPPAGSKIIFWKVAGIGLAVGAAAGALLGASGLAHHAFELLGPAFEGLTGAKATLAAATALGAFGASFGINRDLFRKIFDQTDLLFKGIFTRDKSRDRQAYMEPVQERPVQPEKSQNYVVSTVVYEGLVDYPKSDTYHREKVVASAKQALLSLDPTNIRPH